MELTKYVRLMIKLKQLRLHKQRFGSGITV